MSDDEDEIQSPQAKSTNGSNTSTFFIRRAVVISDDEDSDKNTYNQLADQHQPPACSSYQSSIEPSDVTSDKNHESNSTNPLSLFVHIDFY